MITPEQRIALKGLEWIRDDTASGERWCSPDGRSCIYGDGSCEGNLATLIPVAAILGINPPGYVLVREETVRGALQVCKNHVNLARNAWGLDVSPLVKNVKAALEAALTRKEDYRT